MGDQRKSYLYRSIHQKWIKKRWSDIVALAKNPEVNIESRFRAYETLLEATDWKKDVIEEGFSRLADLRDLRGVLYGADPTDEQRSVRLYNQYCPYKNEDFCNLQEEEANHV